MLQNTRIPSAGYLRPFGGVQDVPYGTAPEQGSKDGSLGKPPGIAIVS